MSSNRWKLSAIAASIAAIIVLFVFINQPKPTQFTAQVKHESFELPDNSHITLFSNAELLVAADFNKEKEQ
ncbi:hypothetical protein [Niabella ginsengisoli]|uniref:Uncharacterized protein n=1 Tax=Niabella ginsengisoli TaxID=522298 RepID=A0ABS9SN58_9BACT|nr:hypothetical protein [Niabella ginsengisoli]MCH5599584.1 hypothetical protein [Niabella ginsengisoli]